VVPNCLGRADAHAHARACPCVPLLQSLRIQGLPGSSRVLQGPPGVQHGSPSVAWFCWARALAGVPPSRASSRMWEDFDQIHQAATPTPPAFSTRQIGHVLVYSHHSFSIASTRASQFFPSGKGTQMEPLSKLPELPPQNWRVSHVIALGDMRVLNPKMRHRPLNWRNRLRFPSSAVGKS
jgi:hypothetical protein